MGTKATKLTNPEVTKVDLVPAGANQGAAVMLFKSRNENKKGVETTSMGKGIGNKFINAISKAFAKVSKDFNGKLVQSRVQNLLDQNWWDFQSALKRSIVETLTDDSLDSEEAQAEIRASLTQFTTAIDNLL